VLCPERPVEQLRGSSVSHPVICVLTLADWSKISSSTRRLCPPVRGGLPEDPLFTLAGTMEKSKLPLLAGFRRDLLQFDLGGPLFISLEV